MKLCPHCSKLLRLGIIDCSPMATTFYLGRCVRCGRSEDLLAVADADLLAVADAFTPPDPFSRKV